MNPLAKVKHTWVKLKFKRNDLRIIEHIPAATFSQILQQYCAQGWELTDAYRPFDEAQRWQGKLRKGTSVLTCIWQPEQAGHIYGLSRIINGMAAQFSLVAKPAPTY
ncbi:hypothetical protein [Salinimonas sediminis]|uniref:DUF4177 domain-containing protein n=1 Tax=Salinimonas sediminis TaxID=2303538 RepID=A0A346NRB9_9ALTE|nr:hypothetical protein [Salinimonas sediminis]AXR08076.1 hypothetical protein D0Y50_17990 [Salinimonas sediminis]